MKARSTADTDSTDTSAARAQDKPDAVEQWPERSSSCWSQLTFSYVTPLLKRGAIKTLAGHDLWPASDEERVRTLRGGGRGLRAKLGAAAFVRHAGAHAFTVNLLRNARVDELRGARLRARLRFREYSKQ